MRKVLLTVEEPLPEDQQAEVKLTCPKCQLTYAKGNYCKKCGSAKLCTQDMLNNFLKISSTASWSFAQFPAHCRLDRPIKRLPAGSQNFTLACEFIFGQGFPVFFRNYLRHTEISGGSASRLRLLTMGLRPGDRIEVITNNGQGQLAISVDMRRYVLGRGLAQKIIVEPEDHQTANPSAMSHRTDMSR